MGDDYFSGVIINSNNAYQYIFSQSSLAMRTSFIVLLFSLCILKIILLTNFKCSDVLLWMRDLILLPKTRFLSGWEWFPHKEIMAKKKKKTYNHFLQKFGKIIFIFFFKQLCNNIGVSVIVTGGPLYQFIENSIHSRWEKNEINLKYQVKRSCQGTWLAQTEKPVTLISQLWVLTPCWVWRLLNK